MAFAFEVEERTVPSGTLDRTLSIYGGSSDKSDAIRVTALPYPVDYKLTYSMWMIAENETDIIVNVCSALFVVHIETEWTRCELVIDNPVGTDVIITPTDETKFWLYRAQLELGEAASDWVPSPDEFNAGSTIRMNEHEIYMATQVFEIDIAQGAELLHIDENGVVTNNLTVNSRLMAPNVAEKYAGATVVSLGTASDVYTEIVWELGLINASTGADAAGDTRIRTTDYITVTDSVNVVIASGSKIAIRAYDSSKAYLYAIGSWNTESFHLMDKVNASSQASNVAYVRFVAAYSDDRTVADVSALSNYVNIERGSQSSGRALLPGNFSLWYAGHYMNGSGSSNRVNINELENWDIYRYAFNERTSLFIKTLTAGTASGVLTLVGETNSTYFPITIANQTVEVDALLINCYKTYHREGSSSAQHTVTPSSFTQKIHENKAMIANGNYIYLQDADNWDVYRLPFDSNTSLLINTLVKNSSINGVVWLAFEQDGQYYTIDIDKLDMEFEATALLINCQKTIAQSGRTITTTAFSKHVENYVANGNNGYVLLEANEYWDIYRYSLGSRTVIRFDSFVETTNPSGIPKLMYELDGKYYWLTQSDVGTTFEADALIINCYKDNGNNFTISSVKITVFDYSSQTLAYSIDRVTYTTEPLSGTLVTDRDYSLEKVEYITDPGKASAASFESLADLANAINNHVLTDSLTVNLTSDIYGGAWIGGMSGIGSLTFNGNGHQMVSNLSIYNQNVPIIFNGVKLKGSIGLNSCKYVDFSNCVLNGNGGSVALYLGQGTVANLVNTLLYNAGTLATVYSGSTFISDNIGGGNAVSFFLNGDKSTVLMSGSRPEGNLQLGTCLSAPADPSVLPTYFGSENSQSVTPPKNLSPIAASSSSTYYEGNWYSESDSGIRQGIMNMGSSGNKVQSGCMWFATSSFSSVTIRSASLILTRMAGKGGSSDVEVYLFGTKVTSRGGNAVSNAVSYGKIGAIGNGETKEFTIPIAAANALKSGSIGGFMLQSSDTTIKNGRGYSSNYAVFYGAGTNYAPVLKIVGQ